MSKLGLVESPVGWQREKFIVLVRCAGKNHMTGSPIGMKNKEYQQSNNGWAADLFCNGHMK